MEQEYYEMNLEDWATSIIEGTPHYSDEPYRSTTNNTELIALTNTYYRSKVFSSHIGINPLINAADPILILLTHLRKVKLPPEPHLFYQNICHELKAFEHKAQTFDYRSSIILAARYIICALLDEFMTITSWPDAPDKTYSFLDHFHKDRTNDDGVFMIMERSLQDPENYLDLLELIYLCLRFGYEGKYRTIDRGYLELRHLTDHLYRVIQQYREECPSGLLICPENNFHLVTKKRNYLHLLPSTWMISTIMILSLCLIFTFLYLKLVETATPINEFLNALQTAK